MSVSNKQASQKYVKLLCDAIIYAKDNGIDMGSAEDGFKHTLLHVYLLDLHQTPPLPEDDQT